MSQTGISPRGHSLEFFPPKTDKGRDRLLDAVKRLSVLGPSFVSVTFGAGGSTRDRSYETATAILKSTHLAVTPHVSCIDSSRSQLEQLLGLYETIGVKRIMALRGDAPKQGPVVTGDFRYANELVAFIRSRFPSFRISVACYPEFHPEASSPSTDLQNFVRKAQAGADEAISQYFFSNDAYYRFRDDVSRQGVDIPLVPGLMPITDFQQIARFSSFCGAQIPQWIAKRMDELSADPTGQAELGIELATRQAEDLLRNDAPGIHFYTLNRAEPTERIWHNLGLSPSDRSANPPVRNPN